MTNGRNGGEAVNSDHQVALAGYGRDLQPYGELELDRGAGQSGDLIDLRKYWNVLLRRKRSVIVALTIAVVTGLVATFTATPIYRGSLLLKIERHADRVLEYQDISQSDSSYWGQKDFYQTQYELMQSRTLARRVIDQLGLEARYEQAADDEPSFVSQLVGSFAGLFADSPEVVSGGDTGTSPDGLEDLFLGNLQISPVKNSRLVRVNYDSPDANEAAAVANAVAKNFIDSTLERRYESNSYAKKFLEERLQQVRANLEDSERRLIAYAREREIVNLDDKLEILMQQLKEMGSRLVIAEADRIVAEAEYNELVEEGSSSMVAVLGSNVIQKLKERKTGLEVEYQENLKVFKPGYPKMQQLRKQIDEVDADIATESASIGNSVKIVYDAKLRTQAKLQARIAEIKGEILALQDRSTDHQTLKREVETNRELYDGLLQRMKEIGVVAGIGTNNISIIDPAEVPVAPYKPSLTKNLVVAIALGLFGGVLLAFLFETLDDTIKSTEDLEKRVSAPVLGVVPVVGEKDQKAEANGVGLFAFENPKSALAEAFRSLRTSLIFATSEGAPKVLHFTSSGPREGKTTSATGSAITFAQTGSKVLLIDADLRDPSLHRVFSLPNSQGLTNYLASEINPADVAQPTQVNRLFCVTSGPLPPNPVELLSSAKMVDFLSLAVERFDFVVVDGPPVIGLADALVLSNLANATVFIAAAGETRSAALEGSVKRLRSANGKIIGSILQKFGRRGAGYGYSYSYDYHYSYEYGERNKPEALPREA